MITKRNKTDKNFDHYRRIGTYSEVIRNVVWNLSCGKQ